MKDTKDYLKRRK